jgi:7,8-dihydropterin-6-yl-methyl-4-(beta-D-ribofuranosyl)aminobenzene 5'-phosphate synthase
MLTAMIAIGALSFTNRLHAAKIQDASTTNMLTIKIVFDNYKHDERLKTSWGFSCFVTGKEKNILFDTGGEPDVLLANMKKMNIDPRNIDIIVLSHEHWDHTGSLEQLLKENNNVSVYMLESFPSNLKSIVKSAGAKLLLVGAKPEQICRDVLSTGSMGFLVKEQALIIKTKRGAVVITGCAHPGITKVVEKAKDVANAEIRLVLGGFHMASASWEKIHSVIENFKNNRVQKVAPCHCSGDETRRLFKESFGNDFVVVGAGSVLELLLD